MNFIGMICVIIATISATLCSAEEPWRTRCVDDFELQFFKHNDNSTLQKTYHEAKVFCESLGGYLAKVDTQEITDVINETIEINYTQSYFIGGNDIRKEKDWKWQDGTDVIMRDEEGYQNWKSNQPNNAGGDEDCMLVGRETYRWVDSSCHDKLNYICQTDVTTQRITKGDFSSSTKKVCRVSKCSDATVKWYKDSSSEPITEEMTENGIYQIINKRSSTLYLKKASISDAGIYHCNSNKSNITVPSLFKVDGNPTIISVNNSACSRSLVVRWKPSKFATGFSHKIVAVNSDTKFETAYGSSKLKSTKTLTTELPGLESGTEYVLTVQVEDYEYSVNATARTIENTESTFSARLSKNCSIQWAWKHNVLPKTATRWEITGFCKRVATRESTNSSNLEIASEGESVSTPHIFIPEPNRNCTVSIKVLGCAGDSEAVNATGFCVGKPAAPTSIAKPVVVEEDIDTKGILRITVTKPDEGNGLISCLFVIVNDGSSHANNEFNWENLAEANGSTNEYIAVALPVSRIPDDEIIVDLGNNSKSACDVTQTKNHMPGQFQPSKTFVGQNWKLNTENFYSVWVVSTTPCGDNICFGTSEKLEFEYENVPPVIVFVAAIVGPILVIAGIIFGIWRFRSKRNPRKREFLPEVNASISDNVELDNISSPPLAAKPEVSVEINDESSGHDNLSASRLSDEQSDTSIRISNFEDVYNLMRKQENAPFNEQFQKIISQSAKLGKPHKIASNSELTKKNRYRNILPFDDTIVKVPAAKLGYINACFVDGHNKRRKYIATQGPLPNTVDDFWQMIIEHKCSLIVMLAKEIEGAKKKCEKYWPGENETKKFGSVLVENTQEIKYGAFIRRKLAVKFLKEDGDAMINVYQYQFMKWPDHGAPPTTSNLLRMHRAVMKCYEKIGAESPIVVHCSAGAGRTGTFVGFDILLDESKTKESVDVFACVLNMRKQRMEMVQNSNQYVLIHKLVLEAILFEERDLSPDEARVKLENIRTPDGESSLRKEFQDLDRIGPMKNSQLRGLAEKNVNMSRSKKVIPYDYTLVKISSQTEEIPDPYINASWVESYDESSPMIASQGPISSNIHSFWSAVLDNNVNTIVMLTELKEGDEEQCAQYWSVKEDEPLKWKNLSVVIVSEDTKDSITERKFKLNSSFQPRTVTQFHYTGWKSTSCPEEGRGIIDLVNKMQKNIRSVGNGATLIHCSDGIGRTGVFCATVNLIDRLKCENRVDVFRTVKDLRDGRPNMVENLDQYKFCYQAIVEYLKSFDLYSNF